MPGTIWMIPLGQVLVGAFDGGAIGISRYLQDVVGIDDFSRRRDKRFEEEVVLLLIFVIVFIVVVGIAATAAAIVVLVGTRRR